MKSPHDVGSRRKLLAGLRAGKTVQAAADAAGYSRTHVYKAAKSDEELARLLETAKTKGGRGRRPPPRPAPSRPRAEALEVVVDAALVALERVLTDPKVPPGVVARAAEAVVRLTVDRLAPPAPKAEPMPPPPAPPDGEPDAEDLGEDDLEAALDAIEDR